MYAKRATLSASRPPPSSSSPSSSKCLLSLPPERVEPVLVGLEHVPHAEAAGVSFVPLLQLPVVGIVGERHVGGGLILVILVILAACFSPTSEGADVSMDSVW